MSDEDDHKTLASVSDEDDHKTLASVSDEDDLKTLANVSDEDGHRDSTRFVNVCGRAHRDPVCGFLVFFWPEIVIEPFTLFYYIVCNCSSLMLQ